MLRYVVAVRQKLEIVLPRQISHESLIGVRLFPAQFVIEMNDGKDDPKFAPQLKEQPQQPNRINPAGNGNSNAIPGTQQIMPNVRQQAQCKGVHENMVQQDSCGDSRLRRSGRAKLD